MKSIKHWSILLTLALPMLAGIGCQKKPPQGAKEMPSPTSRVPSAESAGAITLADGAIQVGPLKMTLPEGWESVAPSSAMRQAQFVLPAAEGSIPGEMTAFYFGPDAGGIEANITRWMNQFQQENGNPITEEMVTRDQFEVNGMPITMVRFEGTQKPSAMAGVQATPELPGYMNVSGIVLTPDGPWFFKGTGPAATMKAQAAHVEEFLRGMQYVGSPHE